MPKMEIIPLIYIAEITAGEDLGEIVAEALSAQSLSLEENDILVVTQKIVSKAEGNIVGLDTITPSLFAEQIALEAGKDPRLVEVILQQTKRVVRMDHGVLICETYHGFICANAGVDQSNVKGSNIVTLLPEEPDVSARSIRDSLMKKYQKNIAVIISDTWGRPWRNGQVNMAIGVAGIAPLIDYRGEKDVAGHILRVTEIAVADEIAGAAELVMGKTENIPVALVRGFKFETSNENAQSLIRGEESDLFR